MMKINSTNVTWHNAKVTKTDRQKLNNHKSCVLWLTGLSGAGKSTLAIEVERELYKYGVRSYVLDGDNVRHGLNKDLGFSPDDRKENIRRIGEVAKLFVDSGLVVIASFISPYKADRDLVRSIYPDGDFIEVYVKCLIDICEQRDPKGLYKMARAGKLKDFTGISAPYEEPIEPELVINSANQDINSSVEQVITYLKQHKYIE
ncbi:adenylyl-sulfate kinase [Paenibacillus whitsoniae]|uniref:Adenylyl-sulfate kinase n=1 Tax=Paenibacillus whitsoniae TaxID=2496558 RepID=A0A3S0A2N7_9BACL|nr:adenylyl-sulfate kinase [Paenibacillus whitsoniae]RTE08148.1 adenylyl-sulfate kinase [Paenibacillus whitsoniae]